MVDLDELIELAQGHLTAGRFPEAKAVVDEAWTQSTEDPRLKELCVNVYLANGIRLAGVAREVRRKEIEVRGRPGEVFEDSEAAKESFRASIAAFDRVLAVDPSHVKALSLKAQALYRMDRANRGAALAAYDEAARILEQTLPPDSPGLNSGKRNLLSARRRIEKPCDWCDDTGFCTECGGSGWRTPLGFRRKCETCLGHGICKRCGIL